MARRVAWICAAAHFVASLAMLFLLREGLPPFDVESRLAYMHGSRGAWLFGWLTWHIAALTLVAFYAVVAMRLKGILSITGVAAAIAGMTLDISSEARYMAVLPELRGEAFLQLDRDLEVTIGYAANGLYTVGFALLLVAGWRVLPKVTLVLGGAVFGAGATLALAALRHDPRLATFSSAALFPLLIVWILIAGQWLHREESS